MTRAYDVEYGRDGGTGEHRHERQQREVEALVAPNGTVKSTKVIGGHPLLAQAAVDAVNKWKFGTAPEDSSELIELKFDPE